jgi:hypothetical protein
MQTPCAAPCPVACHTLLTREEVAAILRVTPRAVNKFAAQGILPQVRLPGRRNALGYLDRDVQALITARTSDGPARSPHEAVCPPQPRPAR